MSDDLLERIADSLDSIKGSLSSETAGSMPLDYILTEISQKLGAVTDGGPNNFDLHSAFGEILERLNSIEQRMIKIEQRHPS